MLKIDLNSDLGENTGNDALIMPFISSCNIACGGHVGDRSSVERTVDLAKKHGVSIGAHPSYPDIANFGRKSISIASADLRKSLEQQIALFKDLTDLQHIKAHGALYNDMFASTDLAELFVQVCMHLFPDVAIMGQPFSALEKVCKQHQIPFIAEVFPDRMYHEQGTLVSRAVAGSVFHDSEQIANRALVLAKNQMFDTLEGKPIQLPAQSLCLHGDNAEAIANAQAVHRILLANQIKVQSPWK